MTDDTVPGGPVSGEPAWLPDTDVVAEERRRLRRSLNEAVAAREEAKRHEREARDREFEKWKTEEFLEGMAQEPDLGPEQLRERRADKERVEEARARVDEAARAADRALEEYLGATVGPRIEGAKLGFEVHKLRATDCGASLVGVAAVSGLVLPPEPRFVWVLCLSFAALLTSMVLSLGIMERYAERVADALIIGAEAEDTGFRAQTARWCFPSGIGLFAAFALQNIAF